jgi:hypothetical protein
LDDVPLRLVVANLGAARSLPIVLSRLRRFLALRTKFKLVVRTVIRAILGSLVGLLVQFAYTGSYAGSSLEPVPIDDMTRVFQLVAPMVLLISAGVATVAELTRQWAGLDRTALAIHLPSLIAVGIGGSIIGLLVDLSGEATRLAQIQQPDGLLPTIPLILCFVPGFLLAEFVIRVLTPRAKTSESEA